jgi:hypothetical protein
MKPLLEFRPHLGRRSLGDGSFLAMGLIVYFGKTPNLVRVEQ